ncbi:hypothetical protein R1flu_028730 [Riccia fluitans]|uniref:Uncharacterized protein n=1 Tax=Riccia fluitans TaxID=41844 RepID=A0ABD1XMI9_9MARC
MAVSDENILNAFAKIQEAWPEFEGENIHDVQKQLEMKGVKALIHDGSTTPPPSSIGTDAAVWIQDVWLYPGLEDQVLGIPARGRWHPDRAKTGWPELVGTPFKEAAKIITAEQLGVKVVYGPEGFIRLQDYRLDRVFLDDDKTGNVALVPRLG